MTTKTICNKCGKEIPLDSAYLEIEGWWKNTYIEFDGRKKPMGLYDVHFCTECGQEFMGGIDLSSQLEHQRAQDEYDRKHGRAECCE